MPNISCPTCGQRITDNACASSCPDNPQSVPVDWDDGRDTPAIYEPGKGWRKVTSAKEGNGNPPFTDPAGMDAARAYVAEHAWIKDPYAGGCQALTYLHGRIIDAVDKWEGEATARERLAERVYRQSDGDPARMTPEASQAS
jgi:hypothetical protein